jgi:hypothetical protein
MTRGRQTEGARSPWRLTIFTWRLNFQIYLSLSRGFLSPYLQKKKKKALAPELFLVLSTSGYDVFPNYVLAILSTVGSGPGRVHQQRQGL